MTSMTLNSLAERSAGYLLRKEVIPKEKLDIYEFGLEILFATMLNSILVVCASLIINVFWETILMLIPFVIIRSKAGGFHAKTHWGCMSGFLTVYVLDALAVTNFAVLSNRLLIIVLLMVSAAAIIVIGALPHENRPVSRDEFIGFRRSARILTVALTLAGLVGACLFPQLFAFYIQGVFIAACSLTAAKIAHHYGRGKDYEFNS